jgi:hypothetical protein
MFGSINISFLVIAVQGSTVAQKRVSVDGQTGEESVGDGTGLSFD